MKGEKKKVLMIVSFTVNLVLGMVWLFDTDRYIIDNMSNIDKAHRIDIITKDALLSYPFDERLIKLVSYGGSIVEIDNIFVDLFAPYSHQLTKIDMEIRYSRDGSTLATSDVFQSNENPEEYILYMNNVYWSTHSKLNDLLKLTE